MWLFPAWDGILISGLMAGDEPDVSFFQDVKAVVKGVPLLLNTGAKPENFESYLEVADGVIVGSSLKVDGYTWNPVDPDRVKRSMDVVYHVCSSEKVQG